jgi:hypothetical protein
MPPLASDQLAPRFEVAKTPPPGFPANSADPSRAGASTVAGSPPIPVATEVQVAPRSVERKAPSWVAA